MPPTEIAAWVGAGVTAACVAAVVAVAPGVGVGSGTRGSPTGALQATDASARPVKTTPTAARMRASLPLSTCCPSASTIRHAGPAKPSSQGRHRRPGQCRTRRAQPPDRRPRSTTWDRQLPARAPRTLVPEPRRSIPRIRTPEGDVKSGRRGVVMLAALLLGACTTSPLPTASGVPSANSSSEPSAAPTTAGGSPQPTLGPTPVPPSYADRIRIGVVNPGAAITATWAPYRSTCQI
jgi:hypothetical protein